MADYNMEEPNEEGSYCPGCGRKVVKSAEICPNCGTRIKRDKRHRRSDLPRTPDGRIVSGEKSMALAIILSIIIPGTGTIYNEKIGKGLIILVASYVLAIVFIGVLIWIYGIYDAYKLTNENNETWYDYLERE